MLNITFWNGNKSKARQGYETELLKTCLNASDGAGPFQLEIDNTDYPSAEDEGNIFVNGADILVTVAGNEKFKDKEKFVIPFALTNGLLGFRLLIVREESLPRFSRVTGVGELQTLPIGIPETWADADLFRHNGFSVVEKGAFADLFNLLKDGAFAYTALGANEVELAFEEFAEHLGGLSIEPALMLYYPFPLVFYVNPFRRDLVEWVTSGLRNISQSGDFDVLFNKHYGSIVGRLRLKDRICFTLQNPLLPVEMSNFKPALWD